MTNQHNYLTHDGRTTWVQAEAVPLTYAVSALFTDTLMRSRLLLHLKLLPLEIMRVEGYFLSLLNYGEPTDYDRYHIKVVDGELCINPALISHRVKVTTILDTMINFIADFGKDTCWPINGVKGSAAIEVIEYLKQLISKEIE